MKITIPDCIKSLKPYKAGKPIAALAREKQLERIVKLASNENPLGPSPKAIEAATAALTKCHRYPEPSCHELVHKLADKFGRRPEEIICGAGTDSLLAYIFNAFADKDQEIVTSEGTFIGTYVSVNKLGRKLNLVPMKNYTFDLETIAEKVGNRTKIVYLANPNNPTGSMFTKAAFDSFMEKIPSSVLVVLDEAYELYAQEKDNYPNGIQIKYDNLIVTRTLSKAYGLAGLRAGYAVGDQVLIDILYRVKLPFEPSLPAQTAAIAALDDQDYLERTKNLNHQSLQRIEGNLKELEINYVPTAANFIMMAFKDETEASRFNEACLSRGLILRHLKPFGIPEGVRINSGTLDETTFAMHVMEQAIAEIRK